MKLVIEYNNPITLDFLRDFSKYFDFQILPESKKKKSTTTSINGVTIVPADSAVDTSDLTKIFSGKNINAGELRKEAWLRKK